MFDRLSFALGAGELLALTGRNGSGKTTLLRALALLVRPEAGTIRWQGADVQDDPEAWRGQLAWLGHLDGLKGDLTVRENLLGAERLRGRPAADDRLDLALGRLRSRMPWRIGRCARCPPASAAARRLLA